MEQENKWVDFEFLEVISKFSEVSSTEIGKDAKRNQRLTMKISRRVTKIGKSDQRKLFPSEQSN